ncbi:Gfo/Idh/MocA family protein [Nocardia nova]
MSDRVVLVGAGGFGRCWEPALLARPDDFTVVGIVEPDPAAAEVAAAVYGLPHNACTSSINNLPRFDATMAIDSSPFAYRLENVQAAFAHGLDVLAAKPLASSFAEALTLVKAADCAGRTLAVAQQMRYFECFLRLRKLVSEEVYGAVRAVDIRMALDGRGWKPGTEWRLELDHPLLCEAGIHHFDLMRWCLAAEIEQVSAAEWNPSSSPFKTGASAHALLRTEHGVPVSYQATFSPAPDQPAVRFDSGWRVYFDRAVLEIRDGGIFIDGNEVLASRPEPQPLERLNEEVLDAWSAARYGNALPLSGTDNLKSMEILTRAVDSATGGNL